MPTVISGAGVDTGSTSYGVNSNRRVVDMADKIFLLEPSAAPLTLLTAKMGKKVAKNPKFEWLEDEAMPIQDTMNGTFLSNVAAVKVDNGEYFSPNSTIKIPATGEVLRVTAVATDTLTVTRSYGGTAKADIDDGAQILILGGNAAENATAEDPRQVKIAEKYNYTEIVRTGFGVSNTVDKSDMYGGNVLAYLHKARGIDHAKSIELKLLWGERAELDGTTVISRATGGVWDFISTNSTDFSSTMTLALIDAASAEDFRYGSKQKMLFVPRLVASALTSLGHSSLQIVPEAKAFGLSITKYITSGGTYNIVPHDLFVSTTYDEVGMVVDIDKLAYRFLRDRDTKLKTNIQTPGQDGREDEYITEMGLERRLEKCHSKWLNCVA